MIIVPTPNYDLEPVKFHSSVPCVPFMGVTPIFPSKASNSEYNSIVNYCKFVSDRGDMPKRCQTCPFGRMEQFLDDLEFKNMKHGKDESIDIQNILLMKYKFGLIKPYNYSKGYLKLKAFINRRSLSFKNKAKMIQLLSKYQEQLRNHSMTITDMDLLVIEETFERIILKFDRVFASMTAPSCLWRRNGEIFKANRYFSFLTGIPMTTLMTGKTLIYELMGDEFAVDYWNKYSEIAFDTSQKAIISITSLMNQSIKREVKCSFSFTIYRDKFQIPIAIIGNFIPYNSVFCQRNTFPSDNIIDNIDSNQKICWSDCQCSSSFD